MAYDEVEIICTTKHVTHVFFDQFLLCCLCKVCVSTMVHLSSQEFKKLKVTVNRI